MPATKISLFTNNRHQSVALLCRYFYYIVAVILIATSTFWRSTEISAHTPISSSIQATVTDFDPQTTYAGRVVVLIGSGFSLDNPSDNHVYFTTRSGALAEATLVPNFPPTSDRLTVYTPHDVTSGVVQVRVGQIPTSCAPCDRECAPCEPSKTSLSVETSIGGIVRNVLTNKKIPGVVVRDQHSPLCATTTEEGVFVLRLPSPPPSSLDYVVDGRTAPTCYIWKPDTTQVTSDSDTHVGTYRLLPIPQGICLLDPGAPCIDGLAVRSDVGHRKASEVAASDISFHGARSISNSTQMSSSLIASGKSAAAPKQTKPAAKTKDRKLSAGRVTLLISGETYLNGKSYDKLILDVFPSERPPMALPLYRYSSTIVQIAPFGVRIEPGAKLIFPNDDKIIKGPKARLFRIDQKVGSPTLGEFIDGGQAIVSEDNKWVETEAGAITESGYYFVSDEWPTATLKGHVDGSDGRPVLHGTVASRGQSTYSDNKGDFELKGVPVVNSGAPATLEVTFLRPDGNVISAERGSISVEAGKVNPVAKIVLPPRPVNPAPVITIQNLSESRTLELRAGEIRNINLVVSELDIEKRSRVGVTGAKFATIVPRRLLWCKKYRLHLAPKDRDVGEHKLTLTAFDSFGASAGRTIAVKVIKQ